MPAKREAKTIQVYLRIRPPNKTEKERGDQCNVINVEGDTIVKLGENGTPFNFHKVFKPDSRQEDVFNSVAKKAVDDCFEGYHGLLFVYGQTGTGKTFTISNKDKGHEGMLQRAVQLVFDNIENDRSGDYEVHCTFIQIYREVIEDLLEKGAKQHQDKKGLAIRDDPDVEGGVYLSPINMMPVYSSGTTAKEGIKAAHHLFELGDRNRSVGATKMNDQSSRSHTVFTLYITRRNKLCDEDYESDNVNKEEFKGRLILVDLAGCERQKKTGASGARLGEANSINSSLLSLGKCIQALTDPKQFVPFRESKLTRLLQYSLSGHGKTSIVVTCGPSETNVDETRGAIEFGQRAMTIKVHAKKHVEIDYKALCKQLQAQLDARGDTANQQLIDEVKGEYDDIIAKKDETIQLLEAELSLYKGEGGGGGGGGGGDRSGYTGSKDKKGGGGGGGGSFDPSAVSDFNSQMKRVEEKLDDKGKELSKLKKDKLALQKEKNNLEGRLQQKTYDLNILAMKMQGSMREKDDQLSRMQAALLKLKRGDYVSPTAQIDVDEPEASPRPENMKDDEYINKLQFAIRKMREREAMMTSYHEKAREAILYQAQKADESKRQLEEIKEKLTHEQDKRRRVEDKLEKYRNK